MGPGPIAMMMSPADMPKLMTEHSKFLGAQNHNKNTRSDSTYGQTWTKLTAKSGPSKIFSRSQGYFLIHGSRIQEIQTRKTNKFKQFRYRHRSEEDLKPLLRNVMKYPRTVKNWMMVHIDAPEIKWPRKDWNKAPAERGNK